jgi:regulator of protease activity HflC (stomatin/prohibitin superfamily)
LRLADTIGPDIDARGGNCAGAALHRVHDCFMRPLAAVYTGALTVRSLAMNIAFIIIALAVAFILIRSIRIAYEWQRAVILRLGRFHKVKGPGLYLVFPIIDSVAQVIDLRIRTTTITAEQALTRDTVAVGVDAIVFWNVEDAEAAAVRIADYQQAIEQVAQTTLREMIGAIDLSKLLSDRKAADEQLRQTISAKTATWGVTARSVEIKDVAIPRELQDAMSRQAQAEREKDARVTLASAERAIAEQVLEAAKLYGSDPNALKLRQMNLLYEMNKERGTTVLIPTDMANSLGTVVALAQATRGIPPS